MSKITMDDGEQAGFDLLAELIPSDLAQDIIRLRRRKKAHMTARIAKKLCSEYRAYGDPEKAAEMQLMRGWVGFEASWVRTQQPIQIRPATPFQQRHQSAMDAFDRKLGIHDEKPSGVIDIGQRDIRTH